MSEDTRYRKHQLILTKISVKIPKHYTYSIFYL